MARMKLGVDLRCLPADGSPGSGVAHAARAVTDAMEALGAHEIIRYAVQGNRHALIAAIQKQPCDLLFVPSGAVSPGLPVPAVPWAHDLDIFEYPEWFPQSWLKRKMTTYFFLRGIRRAPQVFAVSNYTKQAIVRHAGISEERVMVTGLGGDEVLLRATDEDRKRARARFPYPFALVLATVEPRKNIPMMCQVWPEVVKKVPDAKLVIAGKDGWKVGPIQKAMDACPSLVRLSDVDEAMRRDLMLAAAVICVPSLSEGFGLVALEAVQAGTPVLASRRGALPEVLGEGSWLLNPEDPKAWQEGILRVLEGGFPQPAPKESFSWAHVASVIAAELDKNANFTYHP